jgi:hypothetical protein
MPVKQTKEISLAKILKGDKEKIENLEILNASDRKRLGNVIIEQIRDRTRSGVGVTPAGKEYPLSSVPYSPGYAKTKGVSRSAVDLTLTGDMLENMFVKTTDDTSVEISVRARDYGKLRGAEEGIRTVTRDKKGKPISTGLKKRPFFHLSKNDMDKIKNNRDFISTFTRALKRLEKN